MLHTPERIRTAQPARLRGRLSRIRAGASIEEATSPAAVRRREARSRRALALADVVAAGVALVVACATAAHAGLRPGALTLVPTVLLVAKLAGLYDRDDVLLCKTTLDEAPQLFQLAAVLALLLSVAPGSFVAGPFAGGAIVVLCATCFATLVLGRCVARALVRAATQPERCLCIGDADGVERVRAALAQDRRTKAEVVATLALDGAHGPAGSGLRELVAARGVHRVIVVPGADSEAMLDAVRAAKALGVRVSILPRVCEVVGSSVRFDQLGGTTLLGVRRFGLTRSSELVKRGVDVVGASCMLLASAPLLAAIALAIRLDSPGPVFFRQTRVGRGGRRFRIVKFRTMVADAEARKDELRALNELDGLFKIARDPRVTRVGGVLRRSSLDELPQLLNVLRGEMSLVGPRPLVVEEDCQIQGWHRRRLHLTPGLTGHWQVLGSGRISLQEMVKIDYLYVANWSLWLDLKILIRTVSHVFARQGV